MLFSGSPNSTAKRGFRQGPPPRRPGVLYASFVFFPEHEIKRLVEKFHSRPGFSRRFLVGFKVVEEQGHGHHAERQARYLAAQPA